ncbi:MAG: tandem-95 repeat protein [Anaerolineae bacterium]
MDDISQTDEDISITIDVLANDTDIDGDALSVMSVTQPANGTAISNGVNVTYTPNANFNGIDNFTYTVNDGNGGMGTAAVTITVNPVNDVPVGNGDSGITDQGLAVTIDILANDSDIDGDLLMVSSVTQPPNGSVINSGNNVTYIPNDNFTGTDNFAYVVSDPFGGNDSATVIVTVNPISMPNENTVILQVNQSTDDVNEDGTRFESKNQIAWIGNGNSANNNYLGLRFNGVTVPPNAVIDEAYIEVYSSTGSWINVNIEFTAEATGSSQSFGQHNPPSRRLLTGSRVSDRSNVLWTPDSWHSFKDISPVIQEIIGRDDWQSGNSLSVIVRGIGYQWGRKFFTSYDGNPTFAPRLVVSYHLPEIGAIQEQVVPPANEPIASSAIITETQSPTPTELMATTDVPNPTEMPTTEPTLSPTEEPLPTDVSTTEPTLVPTTSPEPTDMPTVEPTPAPTMAPLPTVTISANVVTGAAPLAIQFVSTATDVTDYAWNFGDGVGSSTETNPVYTFTAPGTYLVTLTVNGVGGSVTATMTITVTE